MICFFVNVIFSWRVSKKASSKVPQLQSLIQEQIPAVRCIFFLPLRQAQHDKKKDAAAIRARLRFPNNNSATMEL
jgi:hypothetical protein